MAFARRNTVDAMHLGAPPFSPSSLELHPGEPVRPPLRLLERRAAAAPAPARAKPSPSPGWWSRLCRALLSGT